MAADLSGKIKKKEGKEELILRIMQFCKMSYELESGMIYVEGGREMDERLKSVYRREGIVKWI